MKLKIALIRRGETEKVAEKFLGATDDSLSEKGKRIIREKCAENAYPTAKYVYSSEFSCSRETASLIYSSPVIILRELNAPDYGDFDGRALPELLQDKAFTKWADSQTFEAFPNGETLYDASARAKNAIREIAAEMIMRKSEECAIISHKMIILAILLRYCVPRSSYTDWELSYGGGYLIEYDVIGATAKVIRKI